MVVLFVFALLCSSQLEGICGRDLKILKNGAVRKFRKSADMSRN